MRRERTDTEREAAEAGRGLRDLAAYVSANGGVHLVCICPPPFYTITPKPYGITHTLNPNPTL
jgi:hypothetical protein